MKTLLVILLGMSSLMALATDEATTVSRSEAYVSANRDQQSSAGGWGQNCTSGTIYCTSGRALGCQSTVAGGDGSECIEHTGSVGWVSCKTFDQTGLVTSSYYDECP